MSSVNNISSNSPIYSPKQVGGKSPAASAAGTSPARGKDSVELSGNSHVGQLLKTLKAGGDVRTAKVASLKAQIAAGTYEDDKKLNAATDRLLDDVLKA